MSIIFIRIHIYVLIIKNVPTIANESKKQLFYIPLRKSLSRRRMDRRLIPLSLDKDIVDGPLERTLLLDNETKTFTFYHVDESPLLSINRYKSEVRNCAKMLLHPYIPEDILADQVLVHDQKNPSVAARLCKGFEVVTGLDNTRKGLLLGKFCLDEPLKLQRKLLK
ncbi:hypothetical protein RFI_35951, partial [Reticulomyxa filosa]